MGGALEQLQIPSGEAASNRGRFLPGGASEQLQNPSWEGPPNLVGPDQSKGFPANAPWPYIYDAK